MEEPFIINLSFGSIVEGSHPFPGVKNVLIQIVNPGEEFPTPAFSFSRVVQFKFLDLEEHQEGFEKFGVKQRDAEDIIQVLKEALIDKANVFVHCHMGVCRSGAVCEVGVMMGFRDRKAYRAPNLAVKKALMKVLGWCYD